MRERAGMAADHPLVRDALRDRGPHMLGALLLPEQHDDEPQAHRRERRRRHEPGHEQRAETVPRRRQRRGSDRRGVEEVRQRQGAERRMEQQEHAEPEDVRRSAVQDHGGRLDDPRSPRVRSPRAPQTEREPGPRADRHRAEEHPHVGGVSPQPHVAHPRAADPPARHAEVEVEDRPAHRISQPAPALLVGIQIGKRPAGDRKRQGRRDPDHAQPLSGAQHERPYQRPHLAEHRSERGASGCS